MYTYSPSYSGGKSLGIAWALGLEVAGAKMVTLYSSLGDRVRPCLKRKKRK